MLRLKQLFGAAALGALCVAGSVTYTPDAQALGKACKNVHFSFTNKHKDGRQIKVVSVKFFDKGDGKWRSENVNDVVCSQNQTCTTSGDNLTDMESDDMTKVRFIYRAKEADGDWSDETEGGDKVPSSPQCNANRTYGPWDITG